MPFYQNNDEQLFIDTGKGRSVTLILRGETMDISALRLLWHNQGQVVRDQNRIGQFEKQLEDLDLTDEQYESITKRIEALQAKPDGLTLLVDLVHRTAKGWTDYFSDPEAEKRGEVLPFTKENIERMGPGALTVISKKLAAHFGLNSTGEEDEPGEAKGRLPEHLQLTNKAVGDSPTGTANSVSTEF